MTYWEAVILAIIQGLTEFLPISSSAHLILPSQLLGFPDQGLAFDVAVHVGTLFAVLLYFRHELQPLTKAFFHSFATRQLDDNARLAWGVIIGTIPAGLIGLLANDFIETNLRSTQVIAITTLIFAPLLYWGYCVAVKHTQSEYSLTLPKALLIGVAQSLALIPGTSRSGVTMTAGFFLGLSPTAAARFSFLLSIPVITLAGGLKTYELVSSAHFVDWGHIAIGVVASAVTAYLTIRFFMAFLQRVGMTPFVIYRILLGLVLLAM